MSEEELKKTLAEYLDNKNLDIPNEFYNAIVFLRDKYFELQKENEELKEQRDNAINLRNGIIEEEKELKEQVRRMLEDE